MLSPTDYINTLDTFNQTELDVLIEKFPASVQDFIDAIERGIYPAAPPPLAMRKTLIRLCLLVSAHVGGAVVYIPLPRDQKDREQLVSNLTRLILQPHPITLDDMHHLTGKGQNRRLTKWPALVRSLAEMLQQEAATLAIPLPEKQRIILALIDCLLIMFSGRGCYIPSARFAIDALRGWMIFRQFKGNNIQELAREHGVTTSAVYGYVRNLKRV